jgi:hypothetical protein
LEEKYSESGAAHARKALWPIAEKQKFPQKNPIGDMKNKYPNETLRFCFGGGLA